MAEQRQIIDTMPLLIAQVDTAQDERTGDFYYRTYAPGVGMAHCDGVYVVNLTNVHRHKEEIMRQADVLVLNNLCDPDLFPIIRSRKLQGKLTVYELCDDLDAVPPGSPVQCFYNHPENRHLIKKLAHYCDAMQFSSPELERKYGVLNPTCAVFPNQILEVPPARRYTRKQDVVVGWGGSLGHLEDMAKLVEPLTEWIMSRNDVLLHLMCADPIWDLYDSLPAHRKIRTQPGTVEDYYRFLKAIDIGVAPLQDTAFNRSRSDVKFLEYAVHGVVPVVQAAGPYPQVVKDGVTGFLFHDTAQLLAILDRLATDFAHGVRVSLSAREYVIRERNQVAHGRARTDFYRARLAETGRQPYEAPRTAHSNGARASVFEALAALPGAQRSGRHVLLHSTRFELLVRGGLLASDLTDTAKASRMFLEAAQLEPGNYLPLMFGAYCTGDTVLAFQQAIAKNPSSIKSFLLLGDELWRKGDTVGALECFQSAAEIFPEFALPYLKCASILKASGLEREAASLTEKARGHWLI